MRTRLWDQVLGGYGHRGVRNLSIGYDWRVLPKPVICSSQYSEYDILSWWHFYQYGSTGTRLLEEVFTHWFQRSPNHWSNLILASWIWWGYMWMQECRTGITLYSVLFGFRKHEFYIIQDLKYHCWYGLWGLCPLNVHRWSGSDKEGIFIV